MYYRAGGLAPVQPILHEPLMLHDGPVTSSKLEKTNGYSKKFIDNYNITKNDIVIVISTSGRNPVPIEVVQYANDIGAFTIGITSIEYSKSQKSRYIEDKKLKDVTKIVIDNQIPEGDAMMSHPDMEEKFASASTIAGSTILNAIFSEAVITMKNSGFDPPVFKSGNLEGTTEHNMRLIDQYKDRIRLN